jgi:chromosome segregation ATPase
VRVVLPHSFFWDHGPSLSDRSTFRTMSRQLDEEAVSLRTQVTELERLRTRSTELIGELRTELQQRADSIKALKRRYDTLQNHFTRASDQLDVLMEERIAIDRECHRLERSLVEEQKRRIDAERLMHEQLLALSDADSCVAAPESWALTRAGYRAMLEQLDAANNELAMLSQQVSKRPVTVGRRIRERAAATLDRIILFLR